MRKRIFILFILFSALVLPVHAKTDNFFAGESVTLDKEVGATSFAAGNNVTASSKIDGASFVAGNNLSLASEQDYLFAAGNNINLEHATAKDIFLAGNQINVQSSTIRDLYAAGTAIRIDSDISRNAYLGAESVTINSRINGDVEISADSITIGEGAEITGTLNYPDNAKINISDSAKIANKTTYHVDLNEAKEKTITSKVLDKLYSYLAMLLIGLILIALNQKVFKQIEKIKKDFKTIVKEFAFGFMFLVAVPVASIIVLCTVIGLPLSIISLMLYGILIYLSVIPTAYYFGNLIFKDKINNKYLVFALTLLIIYALKLIPVIGGLVSFISLCFGLGVYTELFKKQISEK